MNSPAITILYATMTGNAETLARRTGERAQREGWTTEVKNLADCRVAELAQASFVLLIVSTWGDGEPPSDAQDFHDELQAGGTPVLPGLRYAVLGLGDRDYADFNAFSRTLDERLHALGAQRLHPRMEADVQFDETHAEWENSVFPLLARSLPALTH